MWSGYPYQSVSYHTLPKVGEGPSVGEADAAPGRYGRPATTCSSSLINGVG